jgi:hypothetical protein
MPDTRASPSQSVHHTLNLPPSRRQVLGAGLNCSESAQTWHPVRFSDLAGHFHPEKFEDQYEDALKELLKKKQAGEKIEVPKEREPAKVVSLMDALRRSVDAERGGGERRKSERRASSSHRTTKKAARSSARKRAS